MLFIPEKSCDNETNNIYSFMISHRKSPGHMTIDLVVVPKINNGSNNIMISYLLQLSCRIRPIYQDKQSIPQS